MPVSIGTVRFGCLGYTEAAYEQRNHDPSSCPYESIQVDHGRKKEQDGEYYGCGHGRVVAVILDPLGTGVGRHGAVGHCD